MESLTINEGLLHQMQRTADALVAQKEFTSDVLELLGKACEIIGNANWATQDEAWRLGAEQLVVAMVSLVKKQ